METAISGDDKSSQTCSVMLERKSLQHLIHTSDDQTLNRQVCTVEIGTHHLSRDFYNSLRLYGPAAEDNQNDDGMSSWYDHISPEDVAYIDALREEDALADDDISCYLNNLLLQEEFTNSGLDALYLTRALTQLPSCNKICITDACTPLGLARLENNARFNLHKNFSPDSRCSRDFVMHVLETTMVSISLSCIQVTELDICLGLADGRGSHSVTDQALDLHAKYQPLMPRGFASIKILRLVLDPSENSDWDENVSSFLGLFPNLSHFRLHLAGRSSSVEVSCLAEALQKLPLEVFELVNCSTTQGDLMRLLLCHRATAEKQMTLKKIILKDVNIEHGKNGTWKWVRNHLQDELSTCSLVLQDCLVEGTFRMPPTNSWCMLIDSL